MIQAALLAPPSDSQWPAGSPSGGVTPRSTSAAPCPGCSPIGTNVELHAGAGPWREPDWHWEFAPWHRGGMRNPPDGPGSACELRLAGVASRWRRSLFLQLRVPPADGLRAEVYGCRSRLELSPPRAAPLAALSWWRTTAGGPGAVQLPGPPGSSSGDCLRLRGRGLAPWGEKKKSKRGGPGWWKFADHGPEQLMKRKKRPLYAAWSSSHAEPGGTGGGARIDETLARRPMFSVAGCTMFSFLMPVPK